MKPAERIPLLKKLATALSDDEVPWNETALMLRQFGFSSDDTRTYDGFGNLLAPRLYDMVLERLEKTGDDDGLLELERYLDPGDGGESHSSVPSSAGPGPWKDDGSFRLFISHTHPNAVYAGEIKQYLGRYRVECFVAHDDIEPSEKWMRVIESALLTCHAAVALLTPDFRASQWCDQEVGFLLARSLLVVPLILEDDPHGFLSEVQGVKVQAGTRPHPQKAAAHVFSVLATRPQTHDRMVPAVVRRYSDSGSFDSTREAFTLLARISKDAWTPELVDEVERAAIDNSQVKHANLRTGTPVSEAAEGLLAPIKKRLNIDEPVPF